MGHSEGPWRVAFGDEVTASREGIVEGSKHIASCGNTLKPRYEILANAKLIAAAPELLALALAALEWIDAVPQSVVLPAMPGFARDWANEIIAKATK